MNAITLDQFKQWVNVQGYDSSSVAAIRNGEVKNIKEDGITTGWDRFFHTQRFATARNGAVSRYREALTYDYGTTIANRVMGMIDTRGGLTAKLITKGIQLAAKQANEMALTYAGTGEGRKLHLVVGGEFELSAHADAHAKEWVDRYVPLMNRAHKLLGKFPIGTRETVAFNAELINVQRDLNTFKNAIAHALELAENQRTVLDHDAYGLIARLAQKRVEVSHIDANNPAGDAAKDRAKLLWGQTYVKLCAALAKKNRGRPCEQHLLAMSRMDPNEVVRDISFGKNMHYTMAFKFVDDLWERSGIRVDHEKVAKAFKVQHGKVLNSQPWEPIRKTFSCSVPGQTFKLTSAIIPGRHVDPVIGNTYPKGVNSFMCHSTKTSHAVNMALSTCSIDTGNGGEQNVFFGVRHGVHSERGMANAEDRRRANLERAKETVKAAFLAYVKQHGEGNIPKLRTTEGCIALPMTSVSLLTPVWRKGADKNEKRMLADQTRAWGEVGTLPENELVEVKVGDTTYKIRPHVATFNFGVNWGALGKKSFFFGGWDKSSSINNAGMDKLADRVNDFCRDAPNDSYKVKTVKTLFAQLKRILAKKNERSDENDAYKAASRVAVLTYLMDGVPCWNCKSGKDRTGEMDVECKFLSTLIALRQPIPDPGQELDERQKDLFRSIALQSGNLEMQQYNTGIGGFKLSGVDSIANRLGGAEAKTYHKGGSSFTSS